MALNTVGLIVEYNPLHNGHAYHFREAKRLANADTAVAVMSGDFLQRGEPAIVNKWARTEMALHLGIDLVLELPVSYAVQPAEWFAHGAAALLDATGVVSHLCFGSESGELPVLGELAALLASESGALKAAVAEELATGASYPRAYAAAAARAFAAAGGLGGDVDAARLLLEQPNNSLGLHYLIALRRLKSGITPLTLQRQGAGYRDESPRDASIASATAVRRLISGGGSLAAAAAYLPPFTLEILQREFAAGRGPMDWDRFSQPLFSRLLSATPEVLAGHPEMNEGLEHRIHKILPKLEQATVTELIEQLKTKRYTHTKLQRTLMHTLLGHTRPMGSREVLSAGPHYLRVLGFNERGRQLLKKMKKTAKLPIITRAADLSHPQLDADIRASAVYANAMPERTGVDLFRDYRQPPIKL